MQYSFSAYWTDNVGEAINRQCLSSYPIECHEGTEEFESIQRAVNQGIDSRLQAIIFSEFRGQYGKRGFLFTRESVPVLVRRLLESENDSDMGLASSICETLEIELI